MRSSSDRIGALAAALAKAQAEIANPEKSLTATILSPFPREGSRTFRYASLSSGLDLVRKCLGQHEIAVVQATALDQDRDLIRLTTTLVHSSGEWMSSDWPVCPISETAAPHRLGAALTYARRYALFTLVGIAGEDDLDAPDLAAAQIVPREHIPNSDSKSEVSGMHSATSKRIGSSQVNGKRVGSQMNRPGTPTNSAVCLDQLLAELSLLNDTESLAVWAHRALPLKNHLSKENAQVVEDAFGAKLNELTALPESLEESTRQEGTEPVTDQVTTISKPRRERDRNHLKFVAAQPCLICARTPSDAHHLKFAERAAMGRKVSDRFTVPICRLHHRDLHKRGNERNWWEGQGIDPLPIAADFWRTSHPELFGHSESMRSGRAHDLNENHSETVMIRRNNETKPILGSQTK